MSDQEPQTTNGAGAASGRIGAALVLGLVGGLVLGALPPQPRTEAPRPAAVSAGPDDQAPLSALPSPVPEAERETPAQLQAVEERLRALEAQLAISEAEATDLRDLLAASETEAAGLLGQLTAAEAASVAFQEEAARLEAELLEARQRVAFLEERNRTLASDLELALSEATRARQLLEMSASRRATGALEPPPIPNAPASLAEVPAPPPPPSTPQQDPVELLPVLEALLAFSPDMGQGAIEDRLGLAVALQSPARLELGVGPLVTLHRFDAFSGDLLTSELTVRASGADELAAQVAGHLSEVMGEPFSGSTTELTIGSRLRFETSRNSAVLTLETPDRMQLLVEHVGVAAAPIQVFRRDSDQSIAPERPRPTEAAEGEAEPSVAMTEPSAVAGEDSEVEDELD